MSIYTKSGLGVSAPEATQFIQAQAGCSENLSQLMARHDGLVQAVVRQQVLGDLPFEEALQAGRIGLWRAILGFDPERGFAFSTYAWPCIKHRIWRAVKACGQVDRTQIPLDSLEVPGPAVIWEGKAIQRALLSMVDRLPPRLAYVVVARYGLQGHTPFLYRQIGAALGLTKQRAHQLHAEALVRLRHPAFSYRLRSLLDRHTLADYEQADEEAQRWLHQRGGRHARS
ncbi:MAG: sigma-70 family RNA polymerase sigma factor [Chloroflexota bacterium]|nr:sigma-70 family RNA polymerase sigma factor [Chloroflexota bacterium]